MSMLAEPRSRQKWSHDPRNTSWSRDKTKFGYQMLTKMGWSEGKGLGQNLSGNVSHINVNKVGNKTGVGLKKSHDDDWIAHQDDFNTLLSSLNGNTSKSTCETISSLENNVKSSKIRYSRFIKSKDLSNASSQDLACIFGQRTKSALRALHSDDERKSDSSETSCPLNGENCISEELSIKTVYSGLNMDEYFAKKMEALRRKKTVGSPIISITNKFYTNNIDHVEECCITEEKKKKKRKIRNEENPLLSQCSELENNSVTKRKIEREDLLLEIDLVKKKRKKKKRKEDAELVQNYGDQVVVKKKKKKEKKISVDNIKKLK